jgi:hypothetical protein
MNVGLQLYPLLKELAADFDGTLSRVAAIGIRRVEIPSFVLGGRSWKEVRQKQFGGLIAYDELLRLTDAELVKLELDCGWVSVAGQDPVSYLASYPGRFALLHARDYMPGFTPTTELTLVPASPSSPAPAIVGEGIVNYPAVISAARRAGTVECFIEREPPITGTSISESLGRDYKRLCRIVEAADAGS